MSKQEIMKQAVERMLQLVAELGDHGVRADDMPDDLISAQARLRSAREHLQGRIELERLRKAA
ncbi:MAG: hypothetical protein ACLGI7_15915 [Gammaproteobacteria bacterium]